MHCSALQPALVGVRGWARLGQESGHNTGKRDSHQRVGGGVDGEGRMERLRIDAARCSGKGKAC